LAAGGGSKKPASGGQRERHQDRATETTVGGGPVKLEKRGEKKGGNTSVQWEGLQVTRGKKNFREIKKGGGGGGALPWLGELGASQAGKIKGSRQNPSPRKKKQGRGPELGKGGPGNEKKKVGGCGGRGEWDGSGLRRINEAGGKKKKNLGKEGVGEAGGGTKEKTNHLSASPRETSFHSPEWEKKGGEKNRKKGGGGI